MKKLIFKSAALLFILTLSFGCSYAQKVKGNGKSINKTRNVGSFDGVAVAGSFDVFLVSGNEGKLDITVEENLEQYLVTEVKDGELFFLVKESKLKTGPKEFLKTAMISINKDGVLDGSIKLDILDGKDRSEYYHFNGKINKKIWGTSTKETFFKVYIEIKK